MNAYEPQPWSIPYRVIEFLKTQPPGKQFAVAVIAEHLDQRRDAILPCLEAPIKHGVIRKEKIDGIVKLSLGDGTPLPETDDNELPVSQMITPATKWGGETPEQTPAPAPNPAPKPKATKRTTSSGIDIDRAHAAKKDKPVDPGFSFTYHSAGTLTVSKDGQQVTLTMDECTTISRLVNLVIGMTQPVKEAA